MVGGRPKAKLVIDLRTVHLGNFEKLIRTDVGKR